MKKEALRNILPLGSVITLKKGRKKLMIIGRIQQERSSGILYDYAAVLYPEGILDASELYMFQGEDIDRIYHVGLQEEEEFAFRSYMEQKLKELKLLE